MNQVNQVITRWEYYRDESPDGIFTGVRQSPVGQFVTYRDHLVEIRRLQEMITQLTQEHR